jgi:hypothetical protein
VTQNLVREGEVILMSGKKFWNTVLACVLLRKNLRNGLPACSVTKIPLNICKMITVFTLIIEACLNNV